jgi:hypothetical protein
VIIEVIIILMVLENQLLLITITLFNDDRAVYNSSDTV